MKIIAHRGNLFGPSPDEENTIESIENCIAYGLDVEIDVWVLNNLILLGHDNGNYQIEINFVESFSKNLWIHCKNIEALEYFHKSKDTFNFFWHQKDTYTLTSKGYIWSYPGSDQSPNTIEVMPEWNLTQSQLKEKEFNNIAGICTDYPLLLRK